MTLQEFLGLPGLERIKRGTNGQWSGCCPAHPDREPSLSITATDKRILVHCFKDCTEEQICDALRISRDDLYLNSYAQASHNGSRNLRAVYAYTDMWGELVYEKLRYDTEDGKRFSYRRPNGNGGWIWNLRGIQRPLFRLPQVLAAVKDGGTIFVCEGEKDVLVFEMVGEVATTSGGTKTWLPEHANTLAGATNVIVIADDDTAGNKYAETVRASLEGKVGSVTIKKAKQGNDAADHFMHDFGVDDFVPVESTGRPQAGTRRPRSRSRRLLSTT
jgi:5S rRNA maturation endonuclease (ribonuclease M5)